MTHDQIGLRPEFWRRYALEDLTRAEWEALCDGCAKCCLIKLEDEETGAVAYTNIACRLLDLGTCRCGNYALRRQLVAGCVVMNRDNLERVLEWMPKTCAYRLVHEGRDLEPWHPLISGDPSSVHRAGVSLRGRMVPEYDVDEEDWPDFVVEEEILMRFVSDNAGPAHPAVMEAIVRANAGYADSYGEDDGMARVRARLREVFEAPEAAIYLVATGTAANALCLACLCPPWGTVYCHREAHGGLDECGAPEFYTGGAKLTLLDGEAGRIDPESLAGALARTVAGRVHNTQRGALTLTNATELGTVYGPDEVAGLAALARAAGVPVYLDGARFANALAALGCTPAELTWKAGVDALSFGGTKNGLLGVEAVILFDPARAWEFELRRKRGGHLFSKHRYLSAQMEAYLADGLWLELASRANTKAVKLGRGLGALPSVRLMHPVEANIVFATWPRARHRAAMDADASYYLWDWGASLDGPDDEDLLARLVCNWATTETDVAVFLGLLEGKKAAQHV